MWFLSIYILHGVLDFWEKTLYVQQWQTEACPYLWSDRIDAGAIREPVPAIHAHRGRLTEAFSWGAHITSHPCLRTEYTGFNYFNFPQLHSSCTVYSSYNLILFKLFCFNAGKTFFSTMSIKILAASENKITNTVNVHWFINAQKSAWPIQHVWVSSEGQIK